MVASIAGALFVPGQAAASPIGTPADFNGDGYRDVVLPAPAATVSGKEGAGAVVVLYGSANRVSAQRRVVITQDTAGVPGTAETDDFFGAATAFADLNTDGYADLVVGTPFEDDGTTAQAGAVTVLWGGRTGLSKATTLPTPVTEGARYGLDVAAFPRGKAFAHVLVGGWGGSVLYRGPFGTSTAPGGAPGSVLTDRATPSLAHVTLGDLDGDGRPERVLSTVRLGGRSGGDVLVDHNPDGLYEPQRGGDGLVAAVGDINGDGYGDLVAGDPDDAHATAPDGSLGGRISIWYGSKSGVSATASPVRIDQNTPGVPGAAERGDKFGSSLTMSDLNRDGLADIVVGARGEAIGTKTDAGAVTVIPGRRSGTPGSGSYTITQDSPDVPGGSERGDEFGSSLAAADLNKDGRPELIIGAGGEDGYRGAVWVLPGGASRPATDHTAMITAKALGLKGDSVYLGADTGT
ncbi:FG-GAP-like repeat-containing protein [Streptomyces sp. LP11]|uniref:FG-GAP-like repeat-containing protein n=1 Tax=Streptomyces pyxinicus TaxID=2970331 RepID=A0ABT2BB26_9ACTN|nr:FG-GAP-like repeat-containing protein [Streptomyces sp. LP11]MCS0605714.1 FG-GAP-like repeat-containing protein [Streptomyces sp. LP11]